MRPAVFLRVDTLLMPTIGERSDRAAPLWFDAAAPLPVFFAYSAPAAVA